jgi:hypothetical protein
MLLPIQDNPEYGRLSIDELSPAELLRLTDAGLDAMSQLTDERRNHFIEKIFATCEAQYDAANEIGDIDGIMDFAIAREHVAQIVTRKLFGPLL